MATEVESEMSEGATGAKSTRNPGAPRILPLSIKEPDYVPPDFGGSRRTRIGSSFIEQFVAGHDASDVLRELVQNEYDGGGAKLTLTFGSRSLEVTGTGKGIDRGGWERLSVIIGTGNVMGSRDCDFVAQKPNGIGSKNFGLRSLFRFGDKIHVRSGGQVALLDLQTQETGRERDPVWRREKGVRIHVPYRQESTERLEAFTVEREEHALGLMAVGMPDTLVKLAHSGKKQGLREVNIRSIRTGRELQWKQDAKPGHCRAEGVSMMARSGKLIDGNNGGKRFQEEEFSRSVNIPAEYAARRFPDYYKLGGRLKIAVSVPIARKGIDLGQPGHFYYPLKAPSSRTGCVVSVSAPFELNTDRSEINDHLWNDWLIDQAVELIIDLLKSDWFIRYGADAFKALVNNDIASPSRFATKIVERLANDACWPTRGEGEERFALAKQIVLPTDDQLGGFLENKRYLDPKLAIDKGVCNLAAQCGALRFTISSLIRLRCADKEANSLETKLSDADANYHFTDYKAALSGVDLQKRYAAALSNLARKLEKEHKVDLRDTPSTLSATGELKAAAQLMIVDTDLWLDCPEPEDNRLHPDLIPYKAISGHCAKFDEERWLIDAAGRAATAASDDRERETLYRKLLTREAPISRPALKALRNNPVVKNQRGEWVAPIAMVHLKRPLARLLDPAIDAPSKEMLGAPNLMARLRIRDTLNGSDLVRYARCLADSPEKAEQFEKLLTDNLSMMSSAIIEELRAIPCLKARSGKLTTPATLHLDTPTNRLCIGDDNQIAGGTNDALYRKLNLKVAPDSETLLDIIENCRAEDRAPNRPDKLYPALVDAIRRERRAKSAIADIPICWVQGGYHAASEMLVGPRIAAPLAEAIPHHRDDDQVGRAYQELGAPAQENDSHWARFFRHVGTVWASETPLDAPRQRMLIEAYRVRRSSGLPGGLDDVRCLIDDRARLFTLGELRDGKLVEPDFPPLEKALHNANSEIGIIERSEKSRVFFVGLGIRPLSAIAATSVPELGLPDQPPFWYKPKQSERDLAMLHRPLFAHALYGVAYRKRHGHSGFEPSELATIEERLAAIREIAFFQMIKRQYRVGSANVRVPAEVSVSGERICVISPRTKNSFRLLLAEALAEIVGATSVATMHSIAEAFLPLLLCGTHEELTEYLDRKGIPHGRAADEDGGIDLDNDDENDDDAEELALRQVFDNLDTGGSANVEAVVAVAPGTTLTTNPSPQPPPEAPPVDLPNIDEVSLTVVSTKGAKIEPRRSSGRRSGGSPSAWLPPTPAEAERASLLGRRGEELVYHMELQKVRDMGYGEPERYVIWTSLREPGADHDILSIDEQGQPRWLEVKSTTGVDGRFDWSRKEFEKALRERERYELWRVYRVADYAPIAKCFRNPARMLGNHQISLELGMLRANIENLGKLP